MTRSVSNPGRVRQGMVYSTMMPRVPLSSASLDSALPSGSAAHMLAVREDTVVGGREKHCWAKRPRLAHERPMRRSVSVPRRVRQEMVDPAMTSRVPLSSASVDSALPLGSVVSMLAAREDTVGRSAQQWHTGVGGRERHCWAKRPTVAHWRRLGDATSPRRFVHTLGEQLILRLLTQVVVPHDHTRVEVVALDRAEGGVEVLQVAYPADGEPDAGAHADDDRDRGFPPPEPGPRVHGQIRAQVPDRADAEDGEPGDFFVVMATQTTNASIVKTMVQSIQCRFIEGVFLIGEAFGGSRRAWRLGTKGGNYGTDARAKSKVARG